MQAPSATPVIEVDGLVFEYTGTRALDNVGFRIMEGSITALVGPNGAGKTTLLRCISALEIPMSGRISLTGIDVAEHPRECHRRIGHLSDFFGLYDDLTVRQCLTHAARIHGIGAGAAPAAVDEAAAATTIADKLDARPKNLSRGQRQRVAIAQAIIHKPAVLLLDEPASGLDPEARHALSRLFLRLRDGGMTLVVSSHILAELEDYSTHMLVLRGGRIVEHRSIGGYIGEGARRLMVRFARPVRAEALAVAPLLRFAPGADTIASIEFDPDDGAAAQLLATLVKAGLPVCEFAAERQNMQDAYLATLKDTNA